MEQLLAQLIGGAAGGIGGGKAVKGADMGNIGNLIAGAVGGVGGGQLLGGLLGSGAAAAGLSLIHISEPTRQVLVSRMPSSA